MWGGGGGGEQAPEVVVVMCCEAALLPSCTAPHPPTLGLEQLAGAAGKGVGVPGLHGLEQSAVRVLLVSWVELQAWRSRRERGEAGVWVKSPAGHQPACWPPPYHWEV